MPLESGEWSIGIPIGQEKQNKLPNEDFLTKREAQMWEREQMLKHDAKLDMTFRKFL